MNSPAPPNAGYGTNTQAEIPIRLADVSEIRTPQGLLTLAQPCSVVVLLPNMPNALSLLQLQLHAEQSQQYQDPSTQIAAPSATPTLSDQAQPVDSSGSGFQLNDIAEAITTGAGALSALTEAGMGVMDLGHRGNEQLKNWKERNPQAAAPGRLPEQPQNVAHQPTAAPVIAARQAPPSATYQQSSPAQFTQPANTQQQVKPAAFDARVNNMYAQNEQRQNEQRLQNAGVAPQQRYTFNKDPNPTLNYGTPVQSQPAYNPGTYGRQYAQQPQQGNRVAMGASNNARASPYAVAQAQNWGRQRFGNTYLPSPSQGAWPLGAETLGMRFPGKSHTPPPAYKYSGGQQQGGAPRKGYGAPMGGGRGKVVGPRH